MDSISRNVKDLDFSDRRALEHVIGSPLAENQIVVIQVVNSGVTESSTSPTESAYEPQIPDWWKIYDGLDDQEIERLDQAIRQRANLTRGIE